MSRTPHKRRCCPIVSCIRLGYAMAACRRQKVTISWTSYLESEVLVSWAALHEVKYSIRVKIIEGVSNFGIQIARTRSKLYSTGQSARLRRFQCIDK